MTDYSDLRAMAGASGATHTMLPRLRVLALLDELAAAQERAVEGMTRNGDWIQTYTGRQFWPFDPHEDDVSIEDIAHALSMLCRYTGHTREFYSVAQHSVLVSLEVAPEHAREALMHDAAEAYVADMSRPVKRSLPDYELMERRVEYAIANRFELSWPWLAEVKRADNVLLATEARDLLGPPPAPWGLPEPAASWAIVPLPPAEAKALFEARFLELFR